jgi:predicted nucleic acid-binding protein
VLPEPPLVFLDANILFSRTLRDWICLICLRSQHKAFALRWSEDVLAEWIYRLRRANPDHGDRAVGGMRRNLEIDFPDALVTGYDPGAVPSVADRDDRHILAAALHAGAGILVTDDRRARFGGAPNVDLEILTADEFLTRIADEYPGHVLSVLGEQVRYFARRGDAASSGGAVELISRLRKAGAGSFATCVEELLRNGQIHQ